MMPNLGPWFDLEESQPLTQSFYYDLEELLQKGDGQVGHLGKVTQTAFAGKI